MKKDSRIDDKRPSYDDFEDPYNNKKKLTKTTTNLSNFLSTDSDMMRSNNENIHQHNLTKDFSINGSIISNINSSTKDFLNGLQYQFILDKNQWNKQQNCQICIRKFIKFKLPQHHCRLCCNSVCDDCSKNRQKNYRICDFCNYNLTHVNELVMQTLARNKQKEELSVIDLKIKNLQKTEQEKDIELNKLSVERTNQLDKLKNKKLELETNLNSLSKIVDSKKLEKNTKVELIQKKKDLLKEMQKKHQDLDHEKNQINLNLLMQEDSITHKKKMLQE